jgi:hypothetical protein
MERIFLIGEGYDKIKRSWLLGDTDINYPYRIGFKDPGVSGTNLVRLRRWLQENTFGEIVVNDFRPDQVEVLFQNETDAVAFKLGYPDVEWR